MWLLVFLSLFLSELLCLCILQAFVKQLLTFMTTFFFWQRQMIFSADWLRRFFLREVIFSSWRACGRKNIELGHQLLCLSLIQTPEMKLTFICFVV